MDQACRKLPWGLTLLAIAPWVAPAALAAPSTSQQSQAIESATKVKVRPGVIHHREVRSPAALTASTTAADQTVRTDLLLLPDAPQSVESVEIVERQQEKISLEVSRSITEWMSVEAASAESEIDFEVVAPGVGSPYLEPRSASDLVNPPVMLGQATRGGRSDAGWYVSLSPSVVFGYTIDIGGEEIPVTIPAGIPGLPDIQTTVPFDAAIDTNTGFGVSGAVGYRFSDARVELEVGYNYNDVDSITVNDLEASVDGSVDTWQFFVNGYYDIPTNSRFRPYVGGGVGLSILSANDVSTVVPPLGEVSLDDSSTSFVFQLKAGVGYDFSENFNAFVGYRLYGIPGQSFEFFGSDFDADDLYVSSIQLGARYEF